ncbi:hypothetical protein [Demequina sp. SO4-18]|uniref:hypothetical protein n=1 Tax=Demequina sp. SO4-18 TaxID=3401026 RepID=UPI003B594674
MIRPSFRALAVAAGFLGVSLIVAGTASAMAGAPTTNPVASAVQLNQEDPASVTPAVEAGTSGSEPPAEVTAPVEVAPTAIECSDAGVCGGARAAAAPAPVETTDARAPEPAPTAIARPACTPPEPPAEPTDGAGTDTWRKAVDDWAQQWRESARECGWDQHDWTDALGDHPWRSIPGDARQWRGDDRDGWADGDPRGHTRWRDGPAEWWEDAPTAGREPGARGDR